MKPLTPETLRKSFVNTSKREAAEAVPLFKLDEIEWDKHEVLGWIDKSNPLLGFIVIEVNDEPVGIMLRASKTKPKKTMCALCEDIVDLTDVKLFVAKRAGAAGRRGDTVGTLIHSSFKCSANARRKPNTMEGKADPEGFIARRVEALQVNSQKFAQRVLQGD